MSAAALSAGVKTLGLDVPEAGQAKLLDYLGLVKKWNRVYNLTAVRDAEKMVSQHLLDSLSVAKHLRGSALIDVGSGAGLPGIPLAIARPELDVTLLESNQKKSTFLTQALIELGLNNVDVVNVRAEAWREAQYDTVISRAFSSLAEFVSLAGHLATKDGVLAAMKGVYPDDEISELPPSHRVIETVSLEVPGVDAKRHLILLGRV